MSNFEKAVSQAKGRFPECSVRYTGGFVEITPDRSVVGLVDRIHAFYNTQSWCEKVEGKNIPVIVGED